MNSLNAKKHPYMRDDFWMNPKNHFWESPMYSKKAKEYYRKWVEEIRSKQRNLGVIENVKTK